MAEKGTKPGTQADVVNMDAVAVLTSIDKGRKMHELAIALEQLTAAVRDTTKKGSIKITIEMKPADNDATQVLLTAEIRGKLPRKNENATLFFTTRSNALVRDNPEQSDLPFGG
jgi:hypothetical protein